MAFTKKDQITEYDPNRITQPPEDGCDIMVKLKDYRDMYLAINHPDEMGGSITVLGLGLAARRPWSDVAAWWPVPSEEDLNFIKAEGIGIENLTKPQQKIMDRFKEGQVLVFHRPPHKKCRYQWDDGKPVDFRVMVNLVKKNLIEPAEDFNTLVASEEYLNYIKAEKIKL